MSTGGFSERLHGRDLADHLRPALEEAFGSTLFFDTRAHLLAPAVELALAAIDDACGDHVMVHRDLLDGIGGADDHRPVVIEPDIPSGRMAD